MTDIASEISKIKELYPEERISESKARLESVWNRQFPKDRIPFVFSSFPFPSHLHGLSMDFAGYDASITLSYQLEGIKAHAVLDDDYVPSLYPGCRQGTIPTAFGCEEFVKDEQFYVRPIVHDIKDIYRLKKPDLAKNGFTRVIIERIRYFRKETEGKLPIHICDMQGPFSIACALWNDEALMLAMADEPKAVRFLLDLATETFIEFVKLQIEAAEGDIIPIHCMPFAWMPREKGISLSDDYLAILSPSLSADFARPCLERIADIFGGLVIHSCGNFIHNLENLRDTKGLLGINFGVSESPIQEIIDKLGTEVVLLPHASEVSSCGVPVLSQ